MRLSAAAFCWIFAAQGAIWGATLGRVVPLLGGGADIALDEPRNRVYLTSATENQVQIYSLTQQKFLTPITTDSTPLSIAISRSGKYLYVTCYNSGVVDVIDLDALAVTTTISVPAHPEGIAVAKDERVLISTAGSGTGSASNTLLLYDPTPGSKTPLTALTGAPAAPAAPTFPPTSGRPFLAPHTQLRATRDGSFIAGVNITSTFFNTGTVYLYQASSGTLLRSRAFTITGFLISIFGLSNVLAISDDGSRLLCGTYLFDTATMQVLGSVNGTNSVFPIAPTTSFTTSANQGGAVFSPDGKTLYGALSVSPVNATGNVGQLLISDPDNLMINMGIQLPEFLAGKIVISADGSNAYALSDSGFVAIPISTISQSPLAVPATDVVQLINDQCGVTGASSVNVTINNPGRGRATVIAQLLQYTQGSPATAPSVRASTSQLTFTVNAAATKGYGTLAPVHDFLLTSPEAINIPDRIRVYQNNRDSDARGTVLPIATGNSLTQSLMDLVYDSTRQRIYIANQGLNRVEVYDISQQQFLTPIKVGQLPQSLALTPDASVLYVANSGGESISIVDPDKMQVTGSVVFSPLPFASNLPVVTPYVMAAGLSGLEILMNNGTLWKVVGNTAIPRPVSAILGTNPFTGAQTLIPIPSTMATSPDGRYILLTTSGGVAYLYDANIDDFVAGRAEFSTTPTGYIGPVAAGPNGQYFLINGTLLNQALVPQTSIQGFISAVATVGNSSFAIFSTPASTANALPTTQPSVQIINANTGNPTLQIPALEGPFTQVSGRATIPGRTMAIDASGSTAYVLTESGLSIVTLATIPQSSRPAPNQKGIVNLASYQTPVAQNGLISIFGQNLAQSATASSTPLPVILGGTCVTLNNVPLPLFMTTPQQINAQIPPTIAAGTYPVVVRSIANQAASTSQQVTVSKYAPAVLVDGSGQIALYHADGTYVNKDNPANRDEPLTMYAIGLGLTTGGRVTAGMPSPSNPLAVAENVAVYFGNPLWVQAAIIVDWAGLAPGMIGIYQMNLRVPGFHVKGDDLLVTVASNGVSSPSTGPVVPHVSVN